MKKLITLICILVSLSVHAQRSADLSVKLLSPANNQHIPIATPFTFDLLLKNNGTDTLRGSDSLQFIAIWDGAPMLFQNGTQMDPYKLYTGITLAGGDSTHISFTMAFANSASSSSSFCPKIIPFNNTALLIDPDTSNNIECVTLIHNPNAVSNTTAEAGLLVYPSPATNMLYFRLKMEHAAQVQFRILDMTGRIIKNELKNLSQGTHNVSIGLNDLAPGNYLYQIVKGENAISGRFVKE